MSLIITTHPLQNIAQIPPFKTLSRSHLPLPVVIPTPSLLIMNFPCFSWKPGLFVYSTPSTLEFPAYSSPPPLLFKPESTPKKLNTKKRNASAKSVLNKLTKFRIVWVLNYPRILRTNVKRYKNAYKWSFAIYERTPIF